MELNKEQKLATGHLNGPMMVVAGPGSGKTGVLAERIRYLIEEYKVMPEDILVITFSRKAAREMQQRFSKISKNSNQSVTFGTFHSIFFHIIQTTNEYKSSLLSNEEKADYIRLAGIKCMCKEATFRQWQLNMLELISSYKNIGEDIFKRVPGCYLSDEERDNFHSIYNYYTSLCRSENKIDFDDMVLICYELLKTNRNILNYYQNKYKYILIDEFQDINMYQYEIVKLLAEGNNNLFCVGDDDQSIYGFRGAYPNIMKCFLEDFPTARSVNLNINYRSKKNIVELANKIINDNKVRIPKNIITNNDNGVIIKKLFASRKDEEDYIISELSRYDGDTLNNTAVILRTNNEVMQYIGSFKKNHILVKTGHSKKKSVFESEVFKDIVSFLKFIYEKPNRDYFISFMNKPDKKIKRMALISEEVREEDILRFYSNDDVMYKEMRVFFSKLKMAGNMKSPKTAIMFFAKAIGYEKYLKSISKDSADYERNIALVNEFADLFMNYKFMEPLEEYANMLKKDYTQSLENNIGELSDGINVMTMHMSKGLEFDTVIIPDVNEGVIPPKNSEENNIEEERRLFYVAVTRAKNRLYILSTKERNREVSRFIK